MVGRDDAVYAISVAAELAGVHPQTLRSYEREGLISPQRSLGNVRRYSPGDVERLREIQHLTQDVGLNLAGVRMVLDLRDRLAAADARAAALQERLAQMSARLAEEVEAVRRAHRFELVPFRPGALERWRGHHGPGATFAAETVTVTIDEVEG